MSVSTKYKCLETSSKFSLVTYIDLAFFPHLPFKINSMALNGSDFHLLLNITFIMGIIITFWGHSGSVVTHLPPTSEASGSNPKPYVGKMVV